MESDCETRLTECLNWLRFAQQAGAGWYDNLAAAMRIDRVGDQAVGGAEDQREEEQAAIDSAHCERAVDCLVDRSIRRAVLHARISLNSAVNPIKRAT